MGSGNPTEAAQVTICGRTIDIASVPVHSLGGRDYIATCNTELWLRETAETFDGVLKKVNAEFVAKGFLTYTGKLATGDMDDEPEHQGPDDLVLMKDRPQEMPEYVSHKTVRAAKIVSFDVIGNNTDDGRDHVTLGYRLHFGDGFPHVMAHPNIFARTGEPEGGDLGYLVQYEDGYQSWSSSGPFEDGYTKVEHSAGVLVFDDEGNIVEDITMHDLANELIEFMKYNLPHGREHSLAKTNIETGMLWARAAEESVEEDA